MDETRFLKRRFDKAWLEVLSEDKRAIFSAAAHAQRAVDYLHSLQVAPAKAA